MDGPVREGLRKKHRVVAKGPELKEEPVQVQAAALTSLAVVGS